LISIPALVFIDGDLGFDQMARPTAARRGERLRIGVRTAMENDDFRRRPDHPWLIAPHPH
jgi:hypothetical protein